MSGVLFGGIEAGGTHFVCAVGTGPEDLRAETAFDTTTPDKTIDQAIQFFCDQQSQAPLRAIGIGSFGPVDLKTGKITATPKADWADVDFARAIQRELRLPVGFDTDVNAAALGQYRWGMAQGLDSFIYLTVGTGIGGGGIIGGQLMHGLLHPEMGHIRIPHDWGADPYPSHRHHGCPFHRDCLEGLASGPALKERWGQPPETLPADHPAWDLEAHYLGLALANFICTLSPRRIILGGGVMKQSQLLPLVHRKVQELLSGYVAVPDILLKIKDYIVVPGRVEESGVRGAIALAQGPWTNGNPGNISWLAVPQG